MSFKPMLAKDGDPSVLTYPVIAQPKLDGIRASVVGGRLVSRTLKAIPNAAIRAALERPEFEGLDGEVIVGPETADDCYRRTASFVMAPNKTDEPWSFMVFDKWDVPGGFWARYNAAKAAILSNPDWVMTPVFIVLNTIIDSPDALEAYEARALAAGHEGVIVRTEQAPYKFGRSGKKGPLLKVKRFIDFEAVVIGYYEEMHNANERYENELGRGQRSSAKAGKVGKERLGGLILRAINGPAEGVEFRCGTGFNAEQREALWWGEALEGRVAKIKSFPIGTKDKPRHPVWLDWRDMEVDG